MAKAICSECRSPVEMAEGEEWGYCPMCENDQVELKCQSIIDKLTELAEEIVIRTEYDTKYGTMGIRTPTPVIRLDKAMEIFKELEQKLEITEKALEFACDIAVGNEEMNCSGINCSDSCIYGVCKDIKKVIDYFKTKAKERVTE